MLTFLISYLFENYFLPIELPLSYSSLAFLVLAWIGKLYEYKLEGKQPPYFKNLQFLFIKPTWVFENIFNYNLSYKE